MFRRSRSIHGNLRYVFVDGKEMDIENALNNDSITLWIGCGDESTCKFNFDCIYMRCGEIHYDDVIMSTIASQITSLTIVYLTIYSGADQSKHQSSASLAFVWGIHRGPVNSPHKWPVTRRMFPFDDVIMLVAMIHCMKCQGKTTTLTIDCCAMIHPEKYAKCIG